jgi:hypothetical protein
MASQSSVPTSVQSACTFFSRSSEQVHPEPGLERHPDRRQERPRNSIETRPSGNAQRRSPAVQKTMARNGNIRNQPIGIDERPFEHLREEELARRHAGS